MSSMQSNAIVDDVQTDHFCKVKDVYKLSWFYFFYSRATVSPQGKSIGNIHTIYLDILNSSIGTPLMCSQSMMEFLFVE